MPSSPLPMHVLEDDEVRSAAVHKAGLFEAPRGERFDRLTRLARRLLQVPIALVSVLDVDRQFFLSAQGLPEPWGSQRFTPLSHSFCRAVVKGGRRLAVRDARVDPEWSSHPAVRDLGVIAYLAVPLALTDGGIIGALCVVDNKSRDWNAEDLDALGDLADVVMAEIAAGLRFLELETISAALRQSEEQHRALFEVSPQVVWFANGQGECISVNQNYADYIGQPQGGRNWLAAVHPDERERVAADWAAALPSGETYESEIRLRRASDGLYRWFLVRAAPLRNADGSVGPWLGVGVDIDDRRRAEATLRELIEAMGVAVFTADQDERLTFFNQAAATLWGWSPPLGDTGWRQALRLYWPDGRPMSEHEGAMARALREQQPIRGQEALAVLPDGTHAQLAVYATPLYGGTGTVIGTVNVLVNVTQRKAAETALAEREVQLRLALEAGQLAFWELDVASGAVLRAAFHDKIFGYEEPLQQWSYDLFLSHVLPEDRASVALAYGSALRDGAAAQVECRIRRAGDGELRWVELHGQPQRGPDGQVVRLHGVLCDVTHRKQTQAALRESEARLRSFLDTVPDAMVVIDERDHIESFSKAAEALFGYSTEEAIGRNISDLILNCRPSKSLGSGSDGANPYIGADEVLTGRRKDGSTFPMELAVNEVQAAGKSLFTCFVRDLSERQATEARLDELQAELLHVSRLSAAGETASALAHELNQPLTAVTSAIRAARRLLGMSAQPDTGPSSEIGQAMDLAAEQALRAGQIVTHLREFVTPGETDQRLEDLPKLVEEAAGLALVGARERGIKVSFRFDPGLPRVLAARIQVQQVILNLVRNALEAMTADEPADGTISHRRELVIAATHPTPDLAVVEVADTGPGLSPEVAGRLFDSFVSTKPGGMGMGLSISRSIIEAHGGRLWAEPNPGGGAVFRFTLLTGTSDRRGPE